MLCRCDEVVLTNRPAHEKYSARIHKELTKAGIIDHSHPLGIDTSKITSKIVSQLSFVSVKAQRKTVGMLFFWEEECIRWRLLEQEKTEIEEAMKQGGVEAHVKGELEMKLQQVKMRMGMRPSHRKDEQSGGTTMSGAEGQGDVAPPEYVPQSG
jgi:hypothetical protein